MALLPRKEKCTILFCDECNSYVTFAGDTPTPWIEFHVSEWPGKWHACSQECALQIQTWCVVESLKDGVCYEGTDNN